MIDPCYVMFRGREEYDKLAEYLDSLGFVWGSGDPLHKWIPPAIKENCLHIEHGAYGKDVYHLGYIPDPTEQKTFYSLPFVTVDEFIGCAENFNDSVSFSEVMGL